MEEFMRAMADPVGYVEAHGGVAVFLARQLMPSNAPLPSVRLTPAPLTPLPGTLHAPSLPPGTSPGLSRPLATPAPTTLGSAVGQVQRRRGAAGYILAGLVIVAVAVALIIVLVGKDKVQAAGTGSEAASGSAVVSGATTGSATSLTGSGTSAGSDGVAAGSAAGTGSNTGSAIAAGTGSDTAGSSAGGSSAAGGSGAAGTGSDTARPITPTIADEPMTQITVTSTPPGARIYVDGADTGRITPGKVEVRKKERSVAILLKLRGYEPFTIRSVDVSDASEQSADLVKIKTTPLPPPPRCKTPERSGCPRDTRGCCVAGAGSGHTGSGNKTGSAADDPDGLLKP
jgi:hypothetical protein